MTTDLHLLRESRSVASIAPTVHEALDWVDEHVNLDRLTLNDVLAAFAAGYRHARDEESSDGC